MAIETELKLRLTPEHLTRLRRHALFKTHQFSAPVTHRLYNIYFDTPDLLLHKRKMAVRLRRVGGRWLQTLKGGGQVKAGLHERLEWEVPVPGAALDFSGLNDWDDYLPNNLRDALRPVFNTDFYRTSRLLNWQGAIIEVCMDHGQVSTDARSTPICEVELELKSGEPLQLFELAKAILDIVPFQLETVSKAEQGFRLLSDYRDSPVKSFLPKLAESDDLTVALQNMVWSCLLHLQGNLNGAMEGLNAEYLHQMRVALRRLRVVLSLCEKLSPDAELSALRAALAAQGEVLGRIRELDVFIADIVEPLQSCIADPVRQLRLQTVLVRVQLLRADCYDALRAQARDLQRVLLRLAIWMNGNYWQLAAQGAPGMRAFAGKRLHQLDRRYVRAARQLHTLDAASLHALRIHAKKLRYSTEFFASLFDTHKIKSCLTTLSLQQEQLGAINDIFVAHRLLDELLTREPEYADIISYVKTSTDNNLSINFKKLKNNLKHFVKDGTRW